MRFLTLIVALAISTSSFSATTGAVTHRRQHGLAQVAPHCVKGVPCGKTCIAKGKVCHAAAAQISGGNENPTESITSGHAAGKRQY